jgi:hypothetical protein
MNGLKNTWNIQPDLNLNNAQTIKLVGDMMRALEMDLNYLKRSDNAEISNRDKLQRVAFEKGMQRKFARIKAEYNAEHICLFLARVTECSVVDIINSIGHLLLLPKSAATKRAQGQDVEKALRQEIQDVLRQLALQSAYDAARYGCKAPIAIHYGEDSEKGIVFKDLKDLWSFTPESKNNGRGSNDPWIIFVQDNQGLIEYGANYDRLSASALNVIGRKIR